MRTEISKLSDKALVQALQRSCLESRRALADIIVQLIEVEDRRIHLKEAFPSLFAYCRNVLHFSEGEAYRRITAARLVNRFPKLLPRIESGDIHLSALVQLRDYFHDANLDHLVDAARGKNKMEIAEIVARLAPRPDVPARLRKVPQYDKGSRVTGAKRPVLEPLSEALYRLQVTGSRAFRDKLLRARDLMLHSNPSGDWAVIVERALDELLKVLEYRRFGKLRKNATAATLEPVPVANDASVGEPSNADASTPPSAPKKSPARGIPSEKTHAARASVLERPASSRTRAALAKVRPTSGERRTAFAPPHLAR